MSWKIGHSVIRLAFLAISLWVVASTLLAVVRAYAPVPIFDQWNSVTPRDYWATLFHQHNEHRILVPRLFFITDLLLFDGSNVFNLASILVIQLAHAGLLIWLAVRALAGDTRSQDGPLGFWVGGTILCLTLWAYQLENFAWGFQVQFVGVVAAASAAFSLLAFSQRRWSRLLWAILLGAISTYMMSNGVLAPLLLLAMALWLRLPWRQVGLLTISAGMLIGAYLHGYHSPPHHTNPMYALAKPVEVLAYLVVYLGGPIGALFASRNDVLSWQPHVSAAMVAGSISLFLFALGVERALRSYRSPATLALLAVMTFVLGSALLTALGRVSFPIHQALSPRYGTPALIFWSAGLALLATRLPRNPLSNGLSLAVAATLSLLVATNQWTFVNLGRVVALERHLGETAILAEVWDEEAFTKLFPAPNFIPGQAALLRSNHLAPFAAPWSGWLGTPLADHVTLLDGTSCDGALDAVDPVPGRTKGRRVRGWGIFLTDGSAPRRAILTDGAGVVIGYAYVGYPVPAARQSHPELKTDRVGFQGHLRPSADAEVRALLLANDNKSACPIGLPVMASPHPIDAPPD